MSGFSFAFKKLDDLKCASRSLLPVSILDARIVTLTDDLEIVFSSSTSEPLKFVRRPLTVNKNSFLTANSTVECSRSRLQTVRLSLCCCACITFDFSNQIHRYH